MENQKVVAIIAISFTAVVCFAIVVAIIGIIVAELRYPGTDTFPLVKVVSGIITTIVGALLGFIAGRATSKNGKE